MMDSPMAVEQLKTKLYQIHYDTLPTETSIRLLQILPIPDGQVSCTMSTVDLKDKPVYDALSYTWKDPIIVRERPWAQTMVDQLQSTISEASTNSSESKPQIILDIDTMMYRQKHRFQPYEAVVHASEEVHAILCNGQSVRVTENLFEALNLFRRILTEVDPSLSENVTSNVGRAISPYIWVDALCINQSDVLEVNNQVKLMSNIFSSAQTVFGWMGKVDEFSKLAIHTLANLFVTAQEELGSEESAAPSIYSFPNIDERHWLAVYAFLRRLWFQRAWIVQEAIFATNLVMSCGPNMFRWIILEKTLTFLEKSGLIAKISAMSMKLMYGEALQSFGTKLQKYGVPVIGAISSSRGSKRRSRVDAKASYAFVEGIRNIKFRLGLPQEELMFVKSARSLEMPDQTQSSAEQPQNRNDHLSSGATTNTWLFENNGLPVIIKAGPTIPTIPTEPFQTAESAAPDTNGTDIEKPNERIVSRAVKLEDIQKANAEALRGQKPQLNYSTGFYSFRNAVTYYVSSQKILPCPLIFLLSTFRDCGSSDPKDKIFAFLNVALRSNPAIFESRQIPIDYRLSVQELYIKTAEFILGSSQSLEILSHIQDSGLSETLGLPSWVPDFSVGLGRCAFEPDPILARCLAGSSDSQRFSLTVENHLIVDGALFDTVVEVESSKGCSFVRAANLALQTPDWYQDRNARLSGFAIQDRTLLFSIPGKHKHLPQRRVEALWRTMILDSSEGHHPAPVRYGFGFADWLAVHLDRTDKLLQMIKQFNLPTEETDGGDAGRSQKQLEDSFMSKLIAWSTLSAGELGSYFSLDELEAVKSFYEADEGLKLVWAKCGQELAVNLEDGGHRFLPDHKRLAEFSQAKLPEDGNALLHDETPVLEEKERTFMRAFEDRMREVKVGRRLFRTKKQYLGMGVSSMQAGDQIYFLRGGVSPLILRPNGEAGFTLVGEGYVHGVMHGEAFEDDSLAFQSIRIS